jgi:CoA-dependent NAD(P)H sulfur oxidoreductase
MKKRRILIVGGNAAGPAAAAKAKRVDPNAEVIMFEKSNFISTGTCEMPYVISGEIENYKDLVFFDKKSFKESKGVEVYTNHNAEEINRKEKFILVRDKQYNVLKKFDYDKLILCTGSKPKLPPAIPQADNIFFLNSITHLKQILDYISENKIRYIAVIGSGYIGLEAVEVFTKIGIKAALIEKEEMPFPTAEPETQKLIKDILTEQKIDFYSGFNKMKIAARNNSLFINIDERMVEADLVIVAAGVDPNNELAVKAKLKTGTSGGLITDKKLLTSDEHIYAAGDNIEVVNAITGRRFYLPLATLAHSCGHIAGENAAGGAGSFDPVIKNISVKIFDKFYAAAGLSTFEAKEENIKTISVFEAASNLVKVMPGSKTVFGKLIADKDSLRILGAEFFGGKEVSGYVDLISALIKLRQPVELLEKIDYNYTPALSPHINLLSILARKIKTMEA